jgi:hypothetical protein
VSAYALAIGGSHEWLDGPGAAIGSVTLADLSMLDTARIRSLTGL